MASTKTAPAETAPAATAPAAAEVSATEGKKTVLQPHEYDPTKVYEDPWNVDIENVVIPRNYAGEDDYIYVSVNGQAYQIPRGKPQTIPLPLYDRYLVYKTAEEKEKEYLASIRKEKLTELKRV